MGKTDSVQRYAPPAGLAARGCALRAEAAADRPFLEHLYTAVRWPELEPSGWPEEAKLGFLRQQYALQDRHYALHYAAGEFLILERDGVPVGRLYLHRDAGDIRIVDISLLPEVRGQGLGTLLLQGVGAEAVAAGQTVSIHVEKFNPAQSLYRRLGFKEIGDSGPYWLMEWRPGEP
ncbi:GNAT family N-acetyltransferase [Methylogaea oryzae]|uniref:N-acetyltransferase n=2 Tax=Methylogaea oryzae TaxID=1295382 RepID=A0A8D5AIC1_9GAMM|nr:GNAT family N-acetyltransferase [Methylogaea oryzae]BBL69584.1 N-acetyltransferase [Methylogaea oryzae]